MPNSNIGIIYEMVILCVLCLCVCFVCVCLVFELREESSFSIVSGVCTSHFKRVRAVTHTRTKQ